jgi:P-type Mg2+ transporter
VTIDFLQTYRSDRAIERLREHVSLTATVLRDGQWQEIKRQDVVPGDIVRLCAGIWFRADGQLLEARDLYVQQGALTGESMPAEKAVGPGEKPIGITPLATDRVFLGRSIVSGTGVARVEATGTRTAFGAIANRLADRPEQTELEHGLRRFGMLITRTVFLLVLFTLVVRVATHKNPFESFVFAVALAVGLTPEFLPMITSVTLGRAAMRMARHKVIVKHLPAIQNFGTMDVFCSDKTGTLTTGKMVVSSCVDSFGCLSDRPLALGYINSTFETGIRNPLEEAILHCTRQNAKAYIKLDEAPFDFDRRRLSVVVKQIGENQRTGC